MGIEREVEAIIYSKRQMDDRYKPFYKSLLASLFTVSCSNQLKSIVLDGVVTLEVEVSRAITEV